MPQEASIREMECIRIRHETTASFPCESSRGNGNLDRRSEYHRFVAGFANLLGESLLRSTGQEATVESAAQQRTCGLNQGISVFQHDNMVHRPSIHGGTLACPQSLSRSAREHFEMQRQDLPVQQSGIQSQPCSCFSGRPPEFDQPLPPMANYIYLTSIRLHKHS
jgi:hypothetical protein